MNGGATGSKGAGVGAWSMRGSGDAIMSLILLTATGVQGVWGVVWDVWGTRIGERERACGRERSM